jgi:hypothetical protein
VRIKYGDHWLTGNGTDPFWTAAQNVRLNGQRVVQEEHFLRAAAMAFFTRGGRSQVLEFSVGREFASHAAAEAFLLTHFQSLPEQADVEIHLHVEPGDDAQIATITGAVLSALPIGPRDGIWIGQIGYALKFGTVSGVTTLPSPEPVVRAGTAAIPSGVDTLALTGLANMGAAPSQIVCTVRKPTAGDFNLVATVLDNSITATGFTVELSGLTDKAGYKLDYQRIY